jgi:polar amino acid transport system substrate-binding protein
MRKAMTPFLTGAALLALAGTTTATQAADLKVAALTGWPPFSGKDLPGKGFSNDVVKTALERMGHTVTVKMMPWARALKMTQAGKYEVLPSVWHSEERAKTLAFADPIAQNKIVFLKRKDDDFQYAGLDSLSGKTVGIVQGYDYSEKFLNDEGFSRQKANSLMTNVRKVLGGRIDLTLGDELVARYAINQEIPERADQIAYTDEGLSKKDLHVTFSRKLDNSDELVSAFNAELAEMREDGTYDEILARHKLAGGA